MWQRLRDGRGRRRHRRAQRALRARARRSASSSSTRSTTRASSRRRASATTRATWPSCARTARGGVCVLGSATPSLESEHLARTGKPTKLRLPDRARAQPMPRVEIVDLRRIGAGPDGRQAHQHAALPRDRGRRSRAREQAILFLNRRGFAPSVRCEACGHAGDVPACSVALTFHKRGGSVVRCHYCDYEAPLGAAMLEVPGRGARARRGSAPRSSRRRSPPRSPTARVARLDRDVASGKKIEAVLGAGARARGRHPRRHADGHQGPRSAERHARRRRQRRRRAQHPRLSRERAGVPAPRAGRRARGPRRHPRAGPRADLGPRAPRDRVRGAARRRRRSSSASSPIAASSATRPSRAARSSASTRSTRPAAREACARLAEVARRVRRRRSPATWSCRGPRPRPSRACATAGAFASCCGRRRVPPLRAVLATVEEARGSLAARRARVDRRRPGAAAMSDRAS